MKRIKRAQFGGLAFLALGMVLIFAFQNCGGALEAFKKGSNDNKDKLSITSYDFSPSEADSDTSMHINDVTGEGITSNDPIKGRVYSLLGQSTLISVNLVPVDPQKTYHLSASIKSVGNGYSRVSFGFISYDENQNPIDAAMVNKSGNPLTVIPENTTADRIEFSGSTANWADPVYAIGYTRHIGIYFDGNTNRLPDYIIGNLENIDNGFGRSSGAYSYLNASNIELNIQIPENILNQINSSTKILNHKSGVTHNYVGALDQEVMSSDNWKDFSKEVSGEDYSEIIYKTFWPGTRYVQLYIFVEPEGGNANKQTLVDDIVLEQI